MLSREPVLRWLASGAAITISIMRNVTSSSPFPCTLKRSLRQRRFRRFFSSPGSPSTSSGRSCSTSLSFTFGVALRTFENAAESSLQPDIFNHPKAQFWRNEPEDYRKMRITVVGGGYVGLVTGACFA